MALLPCIREEYREQFWSVINEAKTQSAPVDIFNMICDCVTSVTGVPDIAKSSRRLREVVKARQFVIWLTVAELRGTGAMTYVQLGKLFKHQFNHATVTHGFYAVQDLLEIDRDTRAALTSMAKMMAGHGYERALYTLENINIIR